mgnify:CR=1 FL=1
MGRIKSRFVKSSGQKIFDEGKEEFTSDFDKNKEILPKYADVPSKKLRNTIAGYITRLVKRREGAEEWLKLVDCV